MPVTTTFTAATKITPTCLIIIPRFPRWPLVVTQQGYSTTVAEPISSTESLLQDKHFIMCTLTDDSSSSSVSHHGGCIAPPLKKQDLEVFNRLEQPIWVFNISKRSMDWANTAGVELWDAKNLAELQQRSFKNMSESTVTRLNDYQENFFKKGQKVRDQWTYYPKGVAKTVRVTMSGMSLEGSDDVLMLNEGVYILENVNEDQKDALRGIELLRHLPISVAQFDMQGNVMYQNPESLDTFGNPAEDKVETENDPKDERKNQAKTRVSDFLARFVDEHVGERVLKQVQAGGDVAVEANQVTRKFGTRWSALKLRQSTDPITSQPVILYSCRDITDIVAAKKERESADKKTTFVALMAHEIRTPLHQVTGFVDLLAQTKLDLEQRSFVKLLQSSTHGLMVVINDVLDYTKLEAGKMKLECIPFNPKMVVQTSMDAVRQSYDNKRLALDFEWDQTIPFKIRGDSNRIRQILLNILNNALKFTQTGGVTIVVTHHSFRTDDGGTDDHGMDAEGNGQCPQIDGVIKFSVRDTGIGISDGHKEIIFQEYQQANVSIARNFGGTGLGLSICKLLVQNMGGTIGVESALNKGSTFWFTLPYELAVEEELTEDVPPQEGPPGTDNQESLHVLVAEDNLVNQKLLESMLKRMGHTSKVVGDGRKAVDEIQRYPKGEFDLVLMDIQMPEMDGFEATRMLRSAGHIDLPIIALTASVQRADFIDLGFNDWIGKPIPMRMLKEKLKRLHECHALLDDSMH